MSDSRIVKPRPISGFPEWLPAEKLVEERMLRIIRREFERFGFTPIETPAVERAEILSAKGIVEKEIYALSRLAAAEGEDASTDLALHFDLTVPLARYVAQHAKALTFPFRRYQIQKVWRGERAQAGRFREFYQCDIDIVGNGTLGLLNDAEIPCVIEAIFSRIGIGDFVIRINNRKLLQGLIEDFGVAAGHAGWALRAIDAIEKVDRAETVASLVRDAGLDPDAAGALVAMLTAETSIAALRAVEGGALFRQGLEELAQVADGLDALGTPRRRWTIDLAIARGLDYYTGTVYETRLVANPEIGSICSGGRYDDLASTFARAKYPGVGISIGLTRLLSRLLEAGLMVPGAATPAAVLVTAMDPAFLADYLGIAAELRAADIDTEFYAESRKLGDQLKYADRKGFRLAVIAGDREIADRVVVIKDLASGDQATHPRAGLGDTVRRLLADRP
jgi:histidyl-tRNA synthetase